MARKQSDPSSQSSRNRGRPRDFHQYRLDGGWEVLAGRTSADNDELSLRVARPDDWWFHIKGMPGSHVILRAQAGREPDRTTLESAAGIAAWHSKARGAGTVAVSCTRARHVSKPRGASAGTARALASTGTI